MKTLSCAVILSNLGIILCGKTYQSDINSITNEKYIPDDKSIEFIHKIKEDLRRNNDDYAEAIAKKSQKETLLQNDLKFRYLKGNASNIIDEGNRRAYEDSRFSDEELKSTDDTVVTTNYLTPKRFSKMTQSTEKTTQKATRIYKSNKENTSKMKMVNNNNESPFKKLFGDIRTTQVQTNKNENVMRMKARNSEPERVLPNSEQLDMAPAKGSRIHMRRIKGRLCQRNVLIPEGPKYDSKGEVYLAAFKPGRNNHVFENTLPPKLILPRCCNCCKKSVLGCA